MIARSPTRLVLALLTALAALFLVLALLPAGPTASATPHAQYPGMLVGGDGSSHRAVLALGWAFGALQIALFAALILFGAGARGRERGLLRPLVGGSVVYLFVWTLVVAAYQGWLAGASGPSVLGFPLPTVLLIFAMWPLPVFYVYLYVRHFDRWVFNADDEARLRDLAERSSQR